MTTTKNESRQFALGAIRRRRESGGDIREGFAFVVDPSFAPQLAASICAAYPEVEAPRSLDGQLLSLWVIATGAQLFLERLGLGAQGASWLALELPEGSARVVVIEESGAKLLFLNVEAEAAKGKN